MRLQKHLGVLALALMFPAASLSGQQSVAPTWTAIGWPYPRDGWPAGRALKCSGGPCADAILTTRVKLGMCNCETGVRDDVEVDGLSDVDLISPAFVPHGPGQPFQAGGLTGRMREYEAVVNGTRKRLVGLVLSRGCDVIAASLVTSNDVDHDWRGDFTRALKNLP